MKVEHPRWKLDPIDNFSYTLDDGAAYIRRSLGDPTMWAVAFSGCTLCLWIPGNATLADAMARVTAIYDGIKAKEGR